MAAASTPTSSFGTIKCLVRGRGPSTPQPDPRIHSEEETEARRDCVSPREPSRWTLQPALGTHVGQITRYSDCQTSHPYILPGRMGPRNSMVGYGRRRTLCLRAALITPYPRLGGPACFFRRPGERLSRGELACGHSVSSGALNPSPPSVRFGVAVLLPSVVDPAYAAICPSRPGGSGV